MSDELEPVVSSSSHRWALNLIYIALLICVGTGSLFYLTTRSIFNRPETSGEPPVDPKRNIVSLEHGISLFAANCATCHGATGLGDGPAGATLKPKPRDFSTGTFKIASTRSGLPTTQDFIFTIRHGLPPSMPPWPQLTDGEVKSLALAIPNIAIEARVAQRLKRGNISREQALQEAHARLDSGPVVQLPPRPASFDLTRGKNFFMNNCATCHDPDGRGHLRDDLVDSDENPITARDLTTTAQFKGGDSIDDIAMRVVRGFPGSPMPAAVEIAPEDLWSTAAYVRTLFDPAFARTQGAQATTAPTSPAARGNEQSLAAPTRIP